MSRLDELGEPLTDELAARFRDRSWWSWFAETEGKTDPETNGSVVWRLLHGSLRADTLTTGEGPWAVIVDGDLDVAGDIELATREYVVSSLIVTGSLRARNVRYRGSARVRILGDALVAHAVIGSGGDAEAWFGAREIEARVVLLDSHTWFDGVFDGILAGARGWSYMPPDLDPFDDEAAFDPAICANASSARAKVCSRRTSSPPCAITRSSPAATTAPSSPTGSNSRVMSSRTTASPATSPAVSAAYSRRQERLPSYRR